MITRTVDPIIRGAIRYAAPGCELRELDQETPKIVGHAAVFDEPTELWPGYFEVIRPGAFTKTLQESDVRALFNHDPNILLARTSSGTLALAEDERGLAYQIDPPATRSVEDLVLVPMRRGDLDGSSFAFAAIKAPETVNENGETLREIAEARLYDTSVVTFPAYPSADAGLRAELQIRAAVQLGRADDRTIHAILEAADLTLEEIRARMASMGSESLRDVSDPVIRADQAELEILRRRLDLMRRRG